MSFWNQRTQESPAENQDDHDSDSESQQVLSVLELIPLKYSPKHNGKVISFIETTNILFDEEKPEKDQTGEQLEKAKTEKERDILNTNGSFKRLKKRILISLNEAFNQIITKKKNSFQVQSQNHMLLLSTVYNTSFKTTELLFNFLQYICTLKRSWVGI